MRTRVWDGDSYQLEWRVGGTQKLDGFFASFRNEVGRRSVNTTGASEKRFKALVELQHELVRTFQLKYWFSGHDVFQLFGAFRRAEAEEPGSAGWLTAQEHIESFQPQSDAEVAGASCMPTPGDEDEDFPFPSTHGEGYDEKSLFGGGDE